jgi:hypothetical protein
MRKLTQRSILFGAVGAVRGAPKTGLVKGEFNAAGIAS